MPLRTSSNTPNSQHSESSGDFLTADILNEKTDVLQPKLPTTILVLVALLQGLALLFLHQAVELDFWPHHSPAWLFSFYSMAVTGPILFLLGLSAQFQLVQFSKYAIPLTLLFGVLGFYVGYQATPLSFVRYDGLFFAASLTLAIGLFKALMYLQQFISGQAFNYSQLFIWSWRNFLTLGLSLLFSGCFWGLLMLWAALFKAIDIKFFYDLFTNEWFYYPAIALANGFGIIIFRQLSHIIDTITRIQQALMKFLLVLVVFVAVIFLGGLIVSGLEPLWDSGGSSLILWMQAFTLFFVNAVYQNEAHERPYSLWLHRFIYCGIALLPIYSAISFYGLMLRIDQYGLSLARCWGMLIWLLLTCFSVGYLWGIIKQKDNWLTQLSRVNVTMGLVVLAFMCLVNSPILDFRKIVVDDQLSRLENGKTDLVDFDIYYFRENLARPGYFALQSFKKEYADTHPELANKITALYTDEKVDKETLYQLFLEELTVIKTKAHPNSLVLSEALPEELTKAIHKSSNQSVHHNSYAYYLMPVDANEDDQTDYLFMHHRKFSLTIKLYFFEKGAWQSRYISLPKQAKTNKEAFISQFKQGEFSLVRSEWQSIQLGDYVLDTQ